MQQKLGHKDLKNGERETLNTAAEIQSEERGRKVGLCREDGRYEGTEGKVRW